ncbi:TonB-dependent receptor [Comamonas sp. 17RB]|uniref:TonB-dependent receptor domain-containing protein n=1 Tax=Comamonas sp. 17RB TaxID=3047025 RepID=UPI0024B75F55|nr:TonB-dependent receptor [Comamonas sp. 17RB]MDI9853978.1 TonB-dependent receptor [Comamonas sp. 17RB]
MTVFANMRKSIKINSNYYHFDAYSDIWEKRYLSAAVALACLSMGAAYAQEQAAGEGGAVKEWRAPAASAREHGESMQQPVAATKALQEVTVSGERTRDEKGHDDVYDKNVTTVYQDREELQRFQATNPGDVFKGMNGVYSMDTRGSQSITPNIRGLTGEGRVPLTIDGTEQSTNIWLHFFGAGNRSYADPAMFRSIEVEKGPSLSRGIKSGIGGAVNIRTIEPSDIIPEGKNFGMELKADTSSNSSKPQIDARSVYGKDYRNIPGAIRYGVNNVSPFSENPRNKGGGDVFDFDSKSGMLSIAGRNEMTDFLASYSKRIQGNYYAGTKNADKYAGRNYLDKSSTDVFIPNVTKLYGAGDEVYNTASENKTTLLKNNWYLPNEQKIGLSFMRNDMSFGETTPGTSLLMMEYRESYEHLNPNKDFSKERRFVMEGPHSEMKVDRYKLDYEIKPKYSKWLNLEASLWHTKTNGSRYQTGISPYMLDMDDDTYARLNMVDLMSNDPNFDPSMLPPGFTDHDGTIVARGRQWTSHDRTGLDLSNQIKLADNMQLVVGINYQREKLDDRIQDTKISMASGGLGIDGSTVHASTDFFGPRSGERKEYSATMNMSYQPAAWLTLTAGTRYMRYTGKDTGKAKYSGAVRKKSGMALEYGEAVNAADLAKIIDLREKQTNAMSALTQADHDAFMNGVTTPVMQAVQDAGKAYAAFMGGRQTWSPSVEENQTEYWVNTAYLPLVNGKPDSSKNPFAQGEMDVHESVDGTLWQQAALSGKKVPKIIPISQEDVYEQLDAGQSWENSGDQSGHAWSPVLSATARIGKFGTGFVRYAQTTRFPSIYELSSSSVIDGAGTLGTLAVNGASKPERSTNFEIGYAHNLTHIFPGLVMADARISYYNTEIKDFIDRTGYMDTIQFDKKKTSGIELQSGFDSGSIYGGLGGTYRLKQEICDKDYASSMDPFYNRIPSCMEGGFPGSYSGMSLQPKYSLNMELGARMLGGRLQVGWRGTYHTGAENKQLNGLLSNADIQKVWFRGGRDALYWKSVMLHDLYAHFQVDKKVALNLNIINLTDQYYMDPMSKNVMPGPGRTITVGMTIKF